MAEYRALGEAVATLLCTSFPTAAERLAAAALDDSDLPAASAAVPTKAPEVQRTPSPAPTTPPAVAPAPSPSLPPAAAPAAAAKVPDDTKAQLARVRGARLTAHAVTTVAFLLALWAAWTLGLSADVCEGCWFQIEEQMTVLQNKRREVVVRSHELTSALTWTIPGQPCALSHCTFDRASPSRRPWWLRRLWMSCERGACV
jgi:hypothetical protein